MGQPAQPLSEYNSRNCSRVTEQASTLTLDAKKLRLSTPTKKTETAGLT